MEHAYATTITVCFEDPFWIALYERIEQGRYTVSKITFGAEPKDHEVYQFLLDHWRHLTFSPPVPVEHVERKRVNPKRARREIDRQLRQQTGIGTKAQQALKLQQEAGKQARKKRSRAEKEAEQERRFAQRQEKRKAKHRGH